MCYALVVKPFCSIASSSHNAAALAEVHVSVSHSYWVEYTYIKSCLLTRAPFGWRGKNLLTSEHLMPPVIYGIKCFVITSSNIFNKFAMFGIVFIKRFSLCLYPPIKQLNEH